MRVLLVLLVAVAAASASRVFLETHLAQEAGRDWTLSRALPHPRELSENEREIIVSIKQQNLEYFEQLFWERTNPKHEDYGKWMTVDEITEIIAPKQESIDIVTEWLEAFGARDLQLTGNRDYLRAKISLFNIERLTNVTFRRFHHPERENVLATLGPYSVPKVVAPHVNMISYVVGLPDIHPQATVSASQASRADPEAITPTVIRARYNCSDVDLHSSLNNSLAVAEFQAQYFSQSDLDQFFQEFVPFAQDGDETVNMTIGVNKPESPGIEASLDIEYIMGVAPGVPAYFFSQYQFNFYNDLINWLTILDTAPAIPLVHTVSYGAQGNYPSATYMSQSDTEYQKLGVRGASIIYASGDSGAQCEGQCKILYPSYPAISVYVTSIGSTKFISGTSGAEAATSAFKSGGGFSDFNLAPDYQADVVKAYLDGFSSNPTGLPPTGSYNASGRGTPDFAALGDEHYQVITGGRVLSIGGTSASAPSFGAVTVMLNEIRLAAGKPSLGFLNPLFYQLASENAGAFFDVVEGDNYKGCGGQCSPNTDGFACTAGWDPVTGMGTPNYAVLSTLV